MIKKAAAKHQKQGIRQARVMRKFLIQSLNDLEEVGGISERHSLLVPIKAAEEATTSVDLRNKKCKKQSTKEPVEGNPSL